jgi:hypothetical protein
VAIRLDWKRARIAAGDSVASSAGDVAPSRFPAESSAAVAVSADSAAIALVISSGKQPAYWLNLLLVKSPLS